MAELNEQGTALTVCHAIVLPAAEGFAFLAGENPGGMVNVVIASDIYTRERSALLGAFVLIDRVLQRDHGAINVVAKTVGSI